MRRPRKKRRRSIHAFIGDDRYATFPTEKESLFDRRKPLSAETRHALMCWANAAI